MARRIGILTLHYAINEGAALQTYALFQRLKHLFSDDIVEVVDYRSLAMEQKRSRYVHSNTLNPILMLHRARRRARIDRFVAESVVLSPARLITDDYQAAVDFISGSYDILIVGSDEIWKIAEDMPFPNVYWLSDRIDGRKIAYAASANKTRYRNLSPGHLEWMRARLNSFNLIGVRDEHTRSLVGACDIDNPSKVRVVPDPTFGLAADDVDGDVERLLSANGIDLSRPILGVTFDLGKANREIISIFKHRGFQTVGITAFNPDVDVNLMGKIDPLMWSRIFGYFTLCLTNLFHGTVFSLKAAIPFLSFDYFVDRDGLYETKLQCLIKQFNALERYVPIGPAGIDASQVWASAQKVLKNHDPSQFRLHVEATHESAGAFLEEIRRIC